MDGRTFKVLMQYRNTQTWSCLIPNLLYKNASMACFCTFQCGLLENLHGIELVSIWRSHLSHKEHLKNKTKGKLRILLKLKMKKVWRKCVILKIRGVKRRRTFNVTFPKDPCPKTLSSSNWEASAFSEPSLTTLVMLYSLTSPSSWRVEKKWKSVNLKQQKWEQQ